jgi:hypothetical protein
MNWRRLGQGLAHQPAAVVGRELLEALDAGVVEQALQAGGRPQGGGRQALLGAVLVVGFDSADGVLDAADQLGLGLGDVVGSVVAAVIVDGHFVLAQGGVLAGGLEMRGAARRQDRQPGYEQAILHGETSIREMTLFLLKAITAFWPLPLPSAHR